LSLRGRSSAITNPSSDHPPRLHHYSSFSVSPACLDLAATVKGPSIAVHLARYPSCHLRVIAPSRIPRPPPVPRHPQKSITGRCAALHAQGHS
jgi:hypothetical protein